MSNEFGVDSSSRFPLERGHSHRDQSYPHKVTKANNNPTLAGVRDD